MLVFVEGGKPRKPGNPLEAMHDSNIFFKNRRRVFLFHLNIVNNYREVACKRDKVLCCMFLFDVMSLTMHRPQYVAVTSDCGTNQKNIPLT